MVWFTHFTRPPRRGAAPGGRNHLRQSSLRARCGVRLQPWVRNRTLIMDVRTRRPAYPDCRRCARLASEDAPARERDFGELAAWPVLG